MEAIMNSASQKTEQTNKRAMFDTAHLFTNSTIASVGAGTAMVASTGMIWPAVAAAAIGALVGYSVTNEIPKNGE
jgi:uncharacterized protein YfiM (DUF2279 family)